MTTTIQSSKTQVTLHLLAFDRVDEREGNSYGKMILMVESGTDHEVAEHAFRDTNAPYSTPEIVSRSGHCYSLSVGDVIEINGTDRFLVVLDMGFTEISRDEFEYLLERHESASRTSVRFDIGRDCALALAERRARRASGLLPA